MQHNPLALLTSAFFHQKLAIFIIFRNADKNCILINDFYLFCLFLSLYGLFQVKKNAILMMSVKLATSDLLEIKYFKIKVEAS